MHCCRMMFLHFLLGKKTEHALLQYLRSLEPNSRTFKFATYIRDHDDLMRGLQMSKYDIPATGWSSEYMESAELR